MEELFPKENTQSTVRRLVEQYNSTPFEITMDFTQIELNITVVDYTHAIEYVALGTKDILKLDDLEVMVMAKNKQKVRMHLLQ